MQNHTTDLAAEASTRARVRCCDGWPEAMTATEVSAHLRLPCLQALALSRSGQLPSGQFGQLWRFGRRRLDHRLATGCSGRTGTAGT